MGAVLALIAVLSAVTVAVAGELPSPAGSQGVAPQASADYSYPVYRLVDASSGVHTYTTNASEYQQLQGQGWVGQGVCLYGTGYDEGNPVFRVYDPHTGITLWTDDEYEYDELASRGWYQQGIAWYQPDHSDYPVYRFYDPMSGEHIITASEGTRQALLAGGAWAYDDVFGYSAAPGEDTLDGESGAGGQEPSTVELPTSPLRLTLGGPAETVSARGEGDGNLTVSSSNDAVATASVSGTTITVRPTGVGSATITVVKAADRMHSAFTGTFSVVVSAQPAGTVTIYRLYNPYTGAHAYTKDATERDTNFAQGWEYEGVAWAAPEKSNAPVWRLYNPNNGDHHYTMSSNEYETLGRQGWRKEGLAWYSDDSKTVPVYRLYNHSLALKGAGSHHYTVDSNEYATLGQKGWGQEDVCWYASAKTVPNAPTKAQVAVNSLNGWWSTVGNSGAEYVHFMNGKAYGYWDGAMFGQPLEYRGVLDVYATRSEWHPQTAITTGDKGYYLIKLGADGDGVYVYGDGYRDRLGLVWGANYEHASASDSMGRPAQPSQELLDLAAQCEK